LKGFAEVPRTVVIEEKKRFHPPMVKVQPSELQNIIYEKKKNT